MHRLLVLITLVMVGFIACPKANGQTAPRFEELPKLAAQWPKPWAALVNEVVPASKNFEKDVLAKLDMLVKAEPLDNQTYPLADILLAATLRHHRSIRRPAPFASDPWQSTQTELEERLADLRHDWLNHLRISGETALALRLADEWLPTAPAPSPVRAAILALWIEQAGAAMDKMDFTRARSWLNRAENAFDDLAPADTLIKRLRGKAEMLQKEAESQPNAQAIRSLEQALALWPRLPGARDALERRQGTFTSLVVAVPALPERLSPATAATNVERQALDLLFDRLYHAESRPLGTRYRPELATNIAGDAPLSLRRDTYWADGRRVTAADVRHTALLMNQADLAGRTSLWREFLEMPRLGSGAFALQIRHRQGLLQPLAPLTFHVLPQYYLGKQLSRADDAEFARSPLGSGPFRYAGRKSEDGKVHALFQANPYDLREGHLREIRLLAINDFAKDLPRPLPLMIMDPPTQQLASLHSLGYADVRAAASSRVQFLAVNHRKTALASVPLRRAIAHALDRQALLDRHFRAAGATEYHQTLNGLAARSSWATCPAPRVPAELYHLEQARLFAKQAKKDVAAVDWTLLFPAGDVHLANACGDMAKAIAAVLSETGIKASVQARALPPAQLRQAILEHKFDLAYTSEGELDDPMRLSFLFDAHEEAVRPGGSNYLGYDGDVKLQELLRAALMHCQFSVAQSNMHAVHAHLYETMPVIPLWHLDTHVLAQPGLRLPNLDSADIFAHVRSFALSR